MPLVLHHKLIVIKHVFEHHDECCHYPEKCEVHSDGLKMAEKKKQFGEFNRHPQDWRRDPQKRDKCGDDKLEKGLGQPFDRQPVDNGRHDDRGSCGVDPEPGSGVDESKSAFFVGSIADVVEEESERAITQ